MDTARLEHAAKLFRQVDDSGPLHIVVSDANVADLDLEFCLGYELAPHEEELISLLKTMPGRDRLVAYHLANSANNWYVNDPLLYAVFMAKADEEKFGPVECEVDGTMMSAG